jgi:hypothetical protein
VVHVGIVADLGGRVNLTAKEFISSYPLAIDAPVWYNTRMNTTTRYSTVRSAAIESFIALLAQATLFDLRAAERWYDEAGAFAESLRPTTGWSLETSASVVSAFSPRVTWAHNKAKATQYAQGIMPKGLRSHVAAANRCQYEGFNGLRGLKTNAFARAIAGDREAVVVDVWMCRAAGLGKDAPNKTEYRAIADAIRTIAGTPAVSMAPATLQALLWIIIRGKAE